MPRERAKQGVPLPTSIVFRRNPYHRDGWAGVWTPTGLALSPTKGRRPYFRTEYGIMAWLAKDRCKWPISYAECRYELRYLLLVHTYGSTVALLLVVEPTLIVTSRLPVAVAGAQPHRNQFHSGFSSPRVQVAGSNQANIVTTYLRMYLLRRNSLSSIETNGSADGCANGCA